MPRKEGFSRPEGTLLGSSAQPCLLPLHCPLPGLFQVRVPGSWTPWCVKTWAVVSSWWKQPPVPTVPRQGSQTTQNPPELSQAPSVITPGTHL